MYKSISSQSFAYFSRPQRAVLREPLRCAAAWRGDQFGDPSEWIMPFSDQDLREIESAIAHAQDTGKPLEKLTAADFPLPGLAARIAGWVREVHHGRGFIVLRGLPVEAWGEDTSSLFFWCLGWHLGIPGAQNRYGDLLGHVRDTGEDPTDPGVREYRTPVRIGFHCDAADIVGLLCLRQALEGGESRIASSVTIYNELLRRRPDLVDRLYEPIALDAHAEGGLRWFPISPCRFDGEHLRTFWHGGYYRSAQRYPDAPRLDAATQELIETYDAIADEPGVALDMRFEPGDIQLLSNHTVVHSRTRYTDHPDPALRRHLLRLWLTVPGPDRLLNRVRRGRDALQVAGRLVRQRIRQRKAVN